MSGNHFDSISEYDAELPVHLVAYYADRKAGLILDVLRRQYGDYSLTILDAGCGTGHHIERLRRAGHRVLGIDNSRRQIVTAQSRNPGAELFCGDLKQLPFEDSSFDVVYTINTLHHIVSLDDQRSAIAELIRVTRPQGLVIIHEMNMRNPLFAWYLRNLFPRLRSIDRGDERWIPDRFWRTIPNTIFLNTRFFTFIPDFIPYWLFSFFRMVEYTLEHSPFKKWSAHYMSVLRVLKK